MTAQNKKKKEGFIKRVREAIFLPFQGRRGFALVFLFVIVVSCVGISSLWSHFGALSINRAEYLITPDQTEITEQPSWIRTDVKADVFRDASWDVQRLSTLDPEVTLKIKQAFELHSWVTQVLQVNKYHPNRIVVNLQYRRPVAMVEVRLKGKTGLYPVDGEGIWLPPKDFYDSAKQAGRFPRIVAADSLPGGLEGTPWGDPRVEGAAKIAAKLFFLWHQAGLSKIQAIKPPGALSEQPLFELRMHAGGKILWGHSPGDELANEPLADEKVAYLESYISRFGRLDPKNGNLKNDLQRP